MSIKKELMKAYSILFPHNVVFIFDESTVTATTYLHGNNIFIYGKHEEYKELVCNIISSWGGVYNETIGECTKYVVISDLLAVDNESIYDKWFNVTNELREAFFITNQCVESICERNVSGTILHVILTDQENVPYSYMIQGMAKKYGPMHIRINGLMTSANDLPNSGETIAYLLDRHSSHVTGECLRASSF